MNFLEQSLKNPFGQHWNSLTKENVQEQILTGADKNGFMPMPLASVFPSASTALVDFGCGIGRNIEPLHTFFKPDYILGYDLPNMIQLMPLETKVQYSKLTSDFEFIEAIKPRLIFASLCFQHIPTVLLSQYVERLSKWPNMLYVVTRRYNDGDHDDVLDILSSYYYPVWLSKDANELSSNENPELHWSGILTPRSTGHPVIKLTTL